MTPAMICCINPDCDQPLNSDSQKYCQNCGTTLVPLLRNRYKVVKPLGRGGFGKTYLAEDADKLNEACVVKQLAYQAQGTWAAKKVTELFEQEAKQLQRLTGHSQIPTLLAYFEEAGSLYLVQEFIEGEDLLKEVNAKGAFNENQIRELLLDIVPVLKFIHEKGIIHRDIKPENIMRRKADGKPVLIDFGVAKLLGPTMMTNTGTTLGSQGYAPLEQIMQGKANAATDLFSLGASCFHLLSGKHPFELWANEGFGWVTSWRTHVATAISPQLGQIIDKLLKREIEERYQTAVEVLEDLQQQYIVSPPAPSQPVSPTIPVPPLTPIPTPQPKVSQPPRVPTPQPQTIPTPPQYAPAPVPNVDSPNRRKLLTYLGLGGLGFAGVVIWANARQNVVSNPDVVVVQPDPSVDSPSTASKALSTEIITVDSLGKEIDRRSLPDIKTISEDLGNGVTLEMVEIPGGKFTMGSPASEAGRYDNESPQHEVTISPFSMGKFAVTQAQWQAVASLPKVSKDLKADPSSFKGKNRPVETVSWYDAVEFCSRLSAKTGKTYRLPSEAEWEYACRAGTTTPFHFGATITTDLANYNGTFSYGSAPKGKDRQGITDVGSFPPNAFGLYDMHGNVWEWCEDVWHDSYQGVPVNGSAWKTGGDNTRRILRGGSWVNNPEFCRSAVRGGSDPAYDDSDDGFRVVFSSPGG